MSDLINRQDVTDCFWDENRMMRDWLDIIKDIRSLPSVEPLTDAEQRIFLEAISREEKVCKIVDEIYEDEGYKLNLVHVCQEIIRKVKGALWT